MVTIMAVENIKITGKGEVHYGHKSAENYREIGGIDE